MVTTQPTRTRNCRESILKFLHDEGGVGAGWYSSDFIYQCLLSTWPWSESYVTYQLAKMHRAGELLRRNMNRGKKGNPNNYDYTLAPPGTPPPNRNERAITSGSRPERTTIDYTHCRRVDCGKELPKREKSKPGPGRMYCNEECRVYAVNERRRK